MKFQVFCLGWETWRGVRKWIPGEEGEGCCCRGRGIVGFGLLVMMDIRVGFVGAVVMIVAMLRWAWSEASWETRMGDKGACLPLSLVTAPPSDECHAGCVTFCSSLAAT